MAAAHECSHRVESETLVKDYYREYMTELLGIAGRCNACPCTEKSKSEVEAFQKFLKKVKGIDTEAQARQEGCEYLRRSCVQP
jgi:hypothetical protein